MGSYTRLDFEERVRIWAYRVQGDSLSVIATKVNRSKSTLCRELSRFRDRGYRYQPGSAQHQASARSRFKKRGTGKLYTHPRLLREVLCGLKKRWSPEQISQALRMKYPKDPNMQVSYETIYTYLYVLPRGELKKELIQCLRQKKKTRRKRAGKRDQRGKFTEMISIEERPKAVEKRSVPGHWEGDLLIGKARQSALGTLVERKTRAVILVPLSKRAPADVRRAFERELRTLPRQMKLSLTYDQGKEMAEHRLFTRNTKMKVYFCHPASPWERGTCENSNGLIRDFFPKKTDFSRVTRRQIKRAQRLLNERPRKTLGFRTPKEVFNQEVLQSFR